MTSNYVARSCESGKKKSKPRLPTYESIRRRLLRDMIIIVQYRYGPQIPNDDAGRGDLDIILKLHAGHPTNGGDRVKHCIDT